MEKTNIKSINSSQSQTKEEYDEPFIYFAFGNICYATATFLLGLIKFYHFNPLFIIHYLMDTFFIIIFFTQNLFGNCYLSKVLFTIILLEFIFSTMGQFADNSSVKKIAGIFDFITAIMAYYDGFGMIINQKRQKVTFASF